MITGLMPDSGTAPNGLTLNGVTLPESVTRENGSRVITGSSRSWRTVIGSDSWPLWVLTSPPLALSKTRSSAVTGVTVIPMSNLTLDPMKTRTLCAVIANPAA